MSSSTTLYQQLCPIRDLFFMEKQTELAKEKLTPLLEASSHFSPEEQRACQELAALMAQEEQDYPKAAALFKRLDDPFHQGYYAMLQGDLDTALSYWRVANTRRKNHWCATLYGLITGQITSVPTLFQVRHYLESDISALIEAQQWDFLENLLGYIDWLNQINPEAYKMVGRALMHAGRLHQSEEYFLKGQQSIPNDPEVYFHLGELYLAMHRPTEAKTMLNQCIMMTPVYRPAEKLLSKITETAVVKV